MLIVAFIVQSTSQLWIIAAFNINRSYIAANLCINRFDAIPVCKGSCYLEDQLNKDHERQQKLPDLKNKEINLFCQETALVQAMQQWVCNETALFPQPNTGFVASGHIHSVFRPPAPASAA